MTVLDTFLLGSVLALILFVGIGGGRLLKKIRQLKEELDSKINREVESVIEDVESLETQMKGFPSKDTVRKIEAVLEELIEHFELKIVKEEVPGSLGWWNPRVEFSVEPLSEQDKKIKELKLELAIAESMREEEKREENE